MTPAENADDCGLERGHERPRAGAPGSIEVGKRANLVLIDGDPVADISDVRRVATVLKGGTVYYASEIYEALGIKPFAAPVKVEATDDSDRCCWPGPSSCR